MCIRTQLSIGRGSKILLEEGGGSVYDGYDKKKMKEPKVISPGRDLGVPDGKSENETLLDANSLHLAIKKIHKQIGTLS